MKCFSKTYKIPMLCFTSTTNAKGLGLVIYMILIIKLWVFISSKNKRIDYTAACMCIFYLLLFK
jgi:hypothetical protein